MILIILAGGFARRLRPISDYIPKPLLPIGGRPIIDHILEHVKNIEFDQIIISTNVKFASQFQYYIGEKNIKLVIEPTTQEEHKFGAVKGISYVLQTLKINSDFSVIAGDNFFNFDLDSAYNAFYTLKTPILGLYDVKHIDEAKRFGVVKIDNAGKVLEISEKPMFPKSTLISMGVYIFPANIIKMIENYVKHSLNKDTLGTFISWILAQTDIYTVTFSGIWADIGTIDAYAALFNKFNYPVKSI